MSHGQAFVHLDDVVEAITRAVDRRRALPPEATFLIGESETYSYDQLQRRLAECLYGEVEWQMHHIPKAVAQRAA